MNNKNEKESVVQLETPMQFIPKNNDDDSPSMKVALKFGTLVSLILAVASIVAVFYQSINNVKKYTDIKIEKIETENNRVINRIDDQLNKHGKTLVKIETILEQKYKKDDDD